MERQRGEIFEYNGEWYQCVEHKGCHSCAFDLSYSVKCSFNGVPHCFYRSDGKPVIFKRLEKVGDTYEKRVSNGTFSTFQRYKVYGSAILPKEPYIYYNFIDSTIEIEIKQNKEDMEENKLNLKPFDIQKAREGKPVCTRDGRKARIVCFDRIDARPILALVLSTDGNAEDVFDYFVSGKRLANALESDLDLMMLTEKKEGWVNVVKEPLGDDEVVLGYIFNSYEDAVKSGKENNRYIATVKIEWEE